MPSGTAFISKAVLDALPWAAAESSNIGAVAFVDRDGRDPAVEEGTLFVQFTGGDIYRYAGVHVPTFDAFVRAESMGRYLHTNIKGRYICEKVEVQQASAAQMVEPTRHQIVAGDGVLVMVLADGETWDGLTGCKIVRLTAEQHEEIENGDASREDFDAAETVATFETV